MEDYPEGAPRNLCITCGIDMGYCNPRQYCRKTYCENEDLLDCSEDSLRKTSSSPLKRQNAMTKLDGSEENTKKHASCNFSCSQRSIFCRC